jgi:outer membrane lipoprotein SlyB
LAHFIGNDEMSGLEFPWIKLLNLRALFMNKLYLAVAVVILGISPHSEARKYSYDEARHGIDIYYGEIEHIEKATTHDAAKKGAMIGGIAGFGYGSYQKHHKTKDTVAGALAGALIGALIDASKNHTYAYTVRLGDNHSVEVISDNSGGLNAYRSRMATG